MIKIILILFIFTGNLNAQYDSLKTSAFDIHIENSVKIQKIKWA